MTAVWLDGPAWSDAACVGGGIPSEAWDLPDGKGMTLTDDNRTAIRICRGCPMRVACARAVLAAHTPDESSVGVIRAGVALRAGTNFRYLSAPTLARLHAIVGAVA